LKAGGLSNEHLCTSGTAEFQPATLEMDAHESLICRIDTANGADFPVEAGNLWIHRLQ
jgi:hypothetical protein